MRVLLVAKRILSQLGLGPDGAQPSQNGRGVGVMEGFIPADWLPTIWAAIIGIGVLVYVVLDGFDLGIGMLFGLAESEAERRSMMGAIAPVWDGNATWLVIVGGGLYGTFPVVYVGDVAGAFICR